MNAINEFNILLKLYRQPKDKAWRRRNRNPKALKPLYPHAIEAVYGQKIKEFQKLIVQFAYERLNKRLGTWIKEGKADSIRLDAFSDELEGFLKELEHELEVVYGLTLISTSDIGMVLENVAKKIFGFEEMQWRKQTLVVLGTEFNMGAPWWDEAKAAWENTNYRLIKSLSQEYIQKLNTLIVTGVQSGWDYDQMVEEIQKLSDKITGYRSEMIARDQVGKLNSALTEAQYAYVGLDTYMWNTARDEKVRGNPMGRYPKAIPSHWAIDGMICKWNDPTVYSDDAGKTWKKRTAIMPLVAPGIEILCFPGETLVKSLTQTEILYRRWYEGRMVTLETSNGFPIRCTPNHPIMRANGTMIPAYLLNEGDAIVKILDEKIVIAKSQIDNGIAQFQNIFDLCAIMFGLNFANTTASDFHGDGIVDEKVDIVPLEGELPEDFISKIDQFRLENIFSEALMCLVNIPTCANTESCFRALGFASDRIVSLFSKLHTLFFTKFFHSEEIRFATASKLFSVFNQSIFNNNSGNSIFFRKGQDRNPLFIFSDNFFYRQLYSVCRHTNIQRMRNSFFTHYLSDKSFTSSCDFHDFNDTLFFQKQTVNIVNKFFTIAKTHVYNLQVPSSRYIVSQEKILVNNCRCLPSPFFAERIAEIDASIDGGEDVSN